jgi:dTDP-4-amino-4,6-dideoxygalactose transaminase
LTLRQVPFFDLRAQHATIRGEVMAAVGEVIESQQFILGPAVANFERDFAARLGARFAIGCASGSDALSLALMVAGVGPGDKVLTSPYTFFATASSISLLGAWPMFADVDPATFNIDVAQARDVLERTPGVKAIIPIHMFGLMAHMEPLRALAREHGCLLIEDAAQAIGASSEAGAAGTLGDLNCFSFFPTKNLGGWGDAGAVTTNSAEHAERLAALRVHGSKRRYYHDELGVNSRLDALQAAVLRVKLRHLDEWTAARRRNAGLYRKLLAGTPVRLPPDLPGHVYHQFVIRALRRDELRAHLQANGVGSEIYYPVPLHLQKCFADLGYREGNFPVSEQCARDSLALPIFPELTEDDIAYVARLIVEFYA